jgi:hypothetical protein
LAAAVTTMVMTTLSMASVAEITAGAEAASTSRPSGSAVGLAVVPAGPAPTPYRCLVARGSTTPCTAPARIPNPTMVARSSAVHSHRVVVHRHQHQYPMRPTGHMG